MIYLLLAAVNFVLLTVSLSIWRTDHSPLSIVAVGVSGTAVVLLIVVAASVVPPR